VLSGKQNRVEEIGLESTFTACQLRHFDFKKAAEIVAIPQVKLPDTSY
jgi:hypothetical protein